MWLLVLGTVAIFLCVFLKDSSANALGQEAASQANLSLRARRPIYVINLDRHKDRLKWLQQQKHFRGWVRWPAINGSTLTDVPARMTKGAAGCLRSHRELWTKCQEQDEAIIVMEDDVCPTQAQVAKWPDLVETADPGQLHLFECSRRQEWACGDCDQTDHFVGAHLTMDHFQDRAKRPGSCVPGARAYLLFPKVAARLLALSQERPSDPTDVVFRRLMQQDSKAVTCAVPRLVNYAPTFDQYHSTNS